MSNEQVLPSHSQVSLPGVPGARGAASPVCLIGGPTAVGKTAVAVELALRLGSEVVSADSMQVYRGLSIGTAKPTASETRGVPYAPIDCLAPEERFNAAQFLRHATPTVDRLLADGRVPIVAGGTGLYLEALREGLFEHPAIPPETRRKVEREVARDGAAASHARLARVDPSSAGKVHPNDRVRLIRALEVYEATGKTITALREEGRRHPPRYDCALFVLNAPRERLYERIDRRVERMFADGLVEETRALLDAGVSPDLHCMKALGYTLVADLLAGRSSLAETIAGVQRTHRRYAKRQLTWFRHMPGARWVSVDGLSPEQVADLVEKDLAPLRAPLR